MFEITLNNLKSAIKHAKNCDIDNLSETESKSLNELISLCVDVAHNFEHGEL